jgi:hypothetical protein
MLWTKVRGASCMCMVLSDGIPFLYIGGGGKLPAIPPLIQHDFREREAIFIPALCPNFERWCRNRPGDIERGLYQFH